MERGSWSGVVTRSGEGLTFVPPEACGTLALNDTHGHVAALANKRVLLIGDGATRQQALALMYSLRSLEASGSPSAGVVLKTRFPEGLQG